MRAMVEGGEPGSDRDTERMQDADAGRAVPVVGPIGGPLAALEVEAAAAAPGTPRRSLWRHPDYMKLWTASTVSLMGSQISLIAIPFIATVVLNASPFQIALLASTEMLPFILFTLPAGAWLDRIRRRPVLIAGDIGRGSALLTIPVAFAAGVLTIWQLYLVAFVTGSLTVLFDVADQSYLPALLDREDLVEGNAKLQIPAAAAQIAGPAIGGGLIGIVAAPFTVILDSVSFFASGGLVSLIRKQEHKPARSIATDGSTTNLRTEIAEGLRYVLGNRHLSRIAGSTATSNLGTSIAFAVFPFFVYRELGLSPALVGAAFGLGSIGILAGAVAAAPLARRFGVGPMIVGSMFATGPAAFLVVFLPSADTSPSSAVIPAAALAAGALLVTQGLLMSFTAVVYNVNQVSYRQAITPLTMQGRMNATMRFIVWGTMPLGSLIGGLLASVFPVRAAILIGAIVASTAFLWVLFSPVRSLREIPTAQPEERA
jgi:MFS family permease